mgnify:CR=1 FL=1
MYLKHYGILGMRWGIRRFQNKDGTLTDIGKERYAKSLEDGNHKRVRIGGSSASNNSDFLKTLSDDELKRLVNRLNLEQQYLNLTKNSQTNLRGYDFVKKVIRDANLVNSSLDAAISFMSKYKVIKEIVENQMKKNRD